MKKLILTSFALLVVLFVFAASSPTPTLPKKIDAAQFYIPIGNSGQKISLLDLSRLSIADAEKISGKKMRAFDRLGFKIAQKKLRNSIDEDGTINNKKLLKSARKMSDGEGFHLGGFALGFLLGLIGVLIAYLINDDLKSNRVKWAWIGWGVWVVIFLLALLVI